MFRFLQSWPTRFVKDMEAKFNDSEKLSLIIENAVSDITRSMNIKNNMDGSSLIGSLIDIFNNDTRSLHIGNDEQREIVSAIVIGCTSGVIEKYIGALSNDDMSELICAFIVYRYAKLNKIESEKDAEIIIAKHMDGLKDGTKEIREHAKNYVLSNFDKKYLTSGRINISDNHEEYDLDAFKACYDLVTMHMKAIYLSTSDYLLEHKKNPTLERAMKILGFEMGVIEYFESAYLNIGLTDENIAECRLLNFFLYYSRERYRDNAEEIGSFFLNELENQAYIKERKLGFESVNNAASNPGHFPGRYFLEACSLT